MSDPEDWDAVTHAVGQLSWTEPELAVLAQTLVDFESEAALDHFLAFVRREYPVSEVPRRYP
jgi:hypothetical protein